jgi:hypothetical protein
MIWFSMLSPAVLNSGPAEPPAGCWYSSGVARRAGLSTMRSAIGNKSHCPPQRF